MVTMSWVYFWLALALTAFVSAFVAYWLGRDLGEKASFMKRWDESDTKAERIMRLSAENHRLRRQVEEFEMNLYPKSVWDNARNVPDQPQ